ncbi:hypothetical protein [Miltoncostaea oceani]|uniref:hypothetical protein n=1 Tax=Miltoncostaea oceani TaxID=2843216 RepID=UPI001C3C59B3|nr:hypothetical protein [Miltoncostaea oceani]
MPANRADDREAQDVTSMLLAVADARPDDDVTRLVELYEATERTYRAAMMAGAPITRASTHTTA